MAPICSRNRNTASRADIVRGGRAIDNSAAEPPLPLAEHFLSLSPRSGGEGRPKRSGGQGGGPLHRHPPPRRSPLAHVDPPHHSLRSRGEGSNIDLGCARARPAS